MRRRQLAARNTRIRVFSRGLGAAVLLLGALTLAIPQTDDGLIGNSNPFDQSLVFACTDADGDGYGSPGNAACPAGPETDCVDTNNAIHPGAVEICNGIDNNCDGAVDNAPAVPAWTAEGNQDGSAFGTSVATAGDVNNDGFDDVIVGVPNYSNDQSNEGRALLYLGSASGLTSVPAWAVEGNQTNGPQLGNSVASAGDVNGDGYSDVIVGSHNFWNGQFSEGRALVYLGTSSGLTASPAWTVLGTQAGGHFGWSVASAGDVNHDGYSDVIVSAYAYDGVGQPDEGRVYLYLGSASGLSTSAAWIAEGNQSGGVLFGYSVASAGDVNGDGFSDVIIGGVGYANGQTDEGRAFVFLGSASGLGATAAWTAESNQTNAQFGSSVASAGDVNGDGYSDVIVGSFLYDNGQTDEGRAQLYLGSASGLAASPAWTAESNQASAQFGVSVASAGDVNGDGRSDVLVGSHLFDTGYSNQGRASLYLGTATGLSASPVWIVDSNQTGAELGFSVATAGDVNGDGRSDLIVGARKFTNGQTSEGKAFVYLGKGLNTQGETTCGVAACQRTVGNCVSGVPQACVPGAPGVETCNGIDDDCDLAIDEGFDADGDGFLTCGGDCNDGNPGIHPGVPEVCNGIDDDCDLAVDEDFDLDGDGYSCGSDCNEANPAVHPGAIETCNTADDNCDGLVDNASAPGVSPTIVLAPTASNTQLSWATMPAASGYDVVRGDLGLLRSSGGDFAVALNRCEGADLSATTLTATDLPSVGNGFFYLMRGRNCGGRGTYDTASPKQIGSRDAEINASASACPFPSIVQIAADPPAFLTQTTTLVRFQAVVPPVPVSNPNSVHLVRIGSPASLCTLLDNGNSANGDDDAGDGVFSCVVSFLEATPAHIGLRVETSAVSSADYFLEAIRPISTAQATTIVTVQQAAFDTWVSMRAAYGDTFDARVHTAEAVALMEGVSSAGVSSDRHTIWISYDSGINGGLILNPPGSIGGGPEALSINRQDSETTAKIVGIAPAAIQGRTPGDLLVGNRKVLIWDSYVSVDDPAQDLYDIFHNSTCPAFDVLPPLVGPACTIASVKNFAAYGTVIIVAHGGIDQHDDVVFLTGERATVAAIASHSGEILFGGVWRGDTQDVFGIRPNFIRKNFHGKPGAFHNGIILNSSCSSFHNYSMADAFFGSGARAYFGYSEITRAAFAASRDQELITTLVQDHGNTGQAFNFAFPHRSGVGACPNSADQCNEETSCPDGAPCPYPSLMLSGRPDDPEFGRRVSYNSGELSNACNAETPCCNGGLCSGGSCVACKADGAACASAQECCANLCTGGVCGCKSDGLPCASAGECCSTTCGQGICGAPSCLPAAAQCQTNGDCCNNRCYTVPGGNGNSECYPGCNINTPCTDDSQCDPGCAHCEILFCYSACTDGTCGGGPYDQ